MIHRALIFGISLLTSIGLVPATSAAVEYVKICNRYGAGWSFIPGTNDCINTATGIIKSTTEDETIISANSALAARVARLEAQLHRVYSQFGMQSPEEKHQK